MDKILEQSRENLIKELERRVDDGIIEKSNADLLKKLIQNAESLTEAISIAELGTTYKRTGFHFDKRLEKTDSAIKYLKRNEYLSFSDGTDDIPNKLIIGDNFDALQNLLIQYKGLVDVIYIDPPYGKDNMGEFADVNYSNALTRDNVLSMLYPRLMLARDLLSKQGAIFCSIDDRNQAYVKGLFDEIFGEKNFMGCFIWQKKTGGGQTDDFFVTEHEYVLAYRRSEEFEWLDFVEDLKEEDFKFYDEEKKDRYATVKLEKWGNSAHKEDRPTMYFPIKDPDGNDFYPVAPDGMPGRWRVGRDRLVRIIETNSIHWKKDDDHWVPYEKKYMKDAKGKLNKSRSILYKLAETGTATKLLTSIFGQKDLFDNPKPIELMEFLLEHVNAELVLDFFAGSGSTGHAVLELNRKDGENRHFILCQNNEITKKNPNGIAYDITSKRLKRIMTGCCYDGSKDFKWIEDNSPLGGSLEVSEISEVANFEKVSGQTPFDVIDETLYGKEKFKTLKEKIEWVCRNFDRTQKVLEDDSDYKKRLEVKK